MSNYTKEQFWKLYKGLPKELQDAIFSEETARDIYDICNRYGVEDNRISEVARYVGRVLLGVLPLDSFQETIEKYANVEAPAAQKISQEIYQFIFRPLKMYLDDIYKQKEIKTNSFIKTVNRNEGGEKQPKEEEIRETPNEPAKKIDVYREPIDE